MVRKVPSKFWNTRLVVVTMLGMELNITVTVQEHQLCAHGEQDLHEKRSNCSQNHATVKYRILKW